MAVTTSTVLPAPVQQTFNMKLLATPTPNMIHNIPANKYTMPRNGGKTMRFRRYNPLDVSMVPLSESAINPPPASLTAVDVDATINWYGNWIALTEQVTIQNQDPVLNAAAIRLGVWLRQTSDQLMRDMLVSTLSVVNSVNGTNGDNPTNLTGADISNVVTTLLGNNGAMFLSTIEGENKFGTAPVRAAYFALAHTDITGQLENIPNFIQQANYPKQERVLDSEWGTVSNLRFLVSSIGSISANASSLGANVYNIPCVAQEGAGSIKQDGVSARFIYHPPRYSNPLELYSTAGAKFAEVPRILNESWVINLRCTLA